MKHCPYCGDVMKDEDRFCMKCGKEFPMNQVTPPVQPQPKVCAKCGAPIAAGETFCAHCGTPVGTPVASPAAPTTRAYRPAPAAMRAPVYPQSLPSRTKLYVAIGIIAVLVIGGGAFYWQSSKSAPQQTVATHEKTAPQPQTAAQAPAATTPQTAAAAMALYIQNKDNYDQRIVEFSQRINGYLQSNPDFRNSSFDTEGLSLYNQIRAERDKLQNDSKIPNDTPGKTQLLALFDLEMTRIKSMADGIAANKGGAEYGSYFKNGTAAAYQFDDANAAFKTAGY